MHAKGNHGKVTTKAQTEIVNIQLSTRHFLDLLSTLGMERMKDTHLLILDPLCKHILIANHSQLSYSRTDNEQNKEENIEFTIHNTIVKKKNQFKSLQDLCKPIKIINICPFKTNKV